MRMTKLEIEANNLLARVLKPREYPYFTEESLDRKIRRAHARNRVIRWLRPQGGDGDLTDREAQDVLIRARLTKRQTEVYFLRKVGFTFEEIGRRSGCTKQGALNVFRQASHKLRLAWAAYPYAGLAEVYRSEVSRR